MHVVFFLNRLHDHVSREAYEEWVRTVDYPTARSIPSIIEYTVTRVEGSLEEEREVPYDYIERVVITDLEAYRRDLQKPELEDFARQWNSYVATSVAIYGTTLS